MKTGFNVISKTMLEDIMKETQIKTVCCEPKDYDYHLNNLKALEGVYQRNFMKPRKHIYN
jgi:hypothetical protein